MGRLVVGEGFIGVAVVVVIVGGLLMGILLFGANMRGG